MATVSSVCSRALRLLGVQDAGEAIQASEFENASDALNAMLRRWEASGISMGWQPSDSPSDVLQVPDEALEAVVYQLAMRLAPEYEVQASQAIASAASGFLDQLRRDVAVANPIRRMGTDAPLGHHLGRWNIYTDSPWGGW